jgi:hypothetical protein
MPLTLLGARLAELRAELALKGCKLAIARHERDTGAAHVRAIQVERDTSREHLSVLLGQTRGGAVATREGAGVAGIDATLHGFVAHKGALRNS